MDTQEKERAQKFIIQNIGGIESAVKSAVTAKDENRKALDNLIMHGGDYSQEYKERAIQELKDKHVARMQAAYDDMLRRLEELRTLIRDRDAVLDLNNPALTNALMLIQATGENLSFEQAIKINANFVHDQSALAALQGAYDAHGRKNAGNIDALIYDADSTIGTLEQLAYAGLVQDGSINFFASGLAKLAALEGATVESTPDAVGADMAMRRAAGLL